MKKQTSKPSAAMIRMVMASLGSSRSPAKVAAARINGAKSKGRPRNAERKLAVDNPASRGVEEGAA